MRNCLVGMLATRIGPALRAGRAFARTRKTNCSFAATVTFSGTTLAVSCGSSGRRQPRPDGGRGDWPRLGVDLVVGEGDR